VPPVPRHFFAVIDASHGGDDRGAALSDKLAEKDVTLALARRLRQELEARGMSTMVLRDSDANLTLDQRAIFTNTAHPVIYVALHAASDGNGVRLYTALHVTALKPTDDVIVTYCDFIMDWEGRWQIVGRDGNRLRVKLIAKVFGMEQSDPPTVSITMIDKDHIYFDANEPSLPTAKENSHEICESCLLDRSHLGRVDHYAALLHV
jgi:hypothetical protein